MEPRPIEETTTQAIGGGMPPAPGALPTLRLDAPAGALGVGVGAPDHLGGYQILEKLGQGGMGVVYRARQAGLDRVVALKLLHGGANADAEAVARFRQEARSAARLRHPNIVAVYDIGEESGQAYFTMDLVDGRPLDRIIRDEDVDAVRAARLAAQVGRALEYAHELGVIHRDIKPGNILVDAVDHALVTDFGLARTIESDVRLTRTGAVMGTPAYMAPEQARGDFESVGPSADVYALGATLYEMLTRRPPFTGPTALEVMRQALSDDPLPPRRLSPRLPRDLELIVLKCLEKETGQRYPSAGALADDLERFLEGRPIAARPRTWGYRLVRMVGRHRALTLAVGLFSVVLLTLAGAWMATERDRGLALALRRYGLLRRGQEALAWGRLREALEALGRARAAFPGDAGIVALYRRALLAAGDAALAKGQVDVAELHYLNARSEGDGSGEAARGLESVRHARGERSRRIEEALRRVSQEVTAVAAGSEPPSEDAMIGWTLDLLALRGEDLVTAMLERAPGERRLREVYARGYAHLQDRRAVGPLCGWLKDESSDDLLRLACSDALTRLGGTEALRAVFDAYAKHPQLAARLGPMLGRLGLEGEDVEAVDANEYVSRGVILAEAGHFEAALRIFSRAIERFRDQPNLLENRALLYQRMKFYNEALADIDRALALRPRASHLLYRRGMILMAAGRHPEACRIFDQILGDRPDDAVALLARAEGALKLNRPLEALPLLERCLQRSPGALEALLFRIQTLVALERWPEALDDAERAGRLAPQSYEVHHERGRILSKLRRMPEAALAYTTAIRLKPKAFECFGNRALVYEQMRCFPEALADFERYLQLAPEHAGATAVRQRLGPLRTHVETLRRHPVLDELERSRGEISLGLLAEALERYQRAFDLPEGRRPEPALVAVICDARFHAACTASVLAGREREAARERLVETALQHLEAAERLGMKYLDYLDQAPELEPLRGEARFEALVGRLKAQNRHK